MSIDESENYVFDYKPGAKCRYYVICPLYNANSLSPEAELHMCGIGQPVEETYIPKVHADWDTLTPTRAYVREQPPENLEVATCVAFEGICLFSFYSDVSRLVEKANTELGPDLDG